MLAEIVYVLRSLRRDAGFTAIVVLTLTLAIGGNAAMLSVVDSIFFEKLPIPNSNRVLRLLSSYHKIDGSVSTVSVRGREFEILSRIAQSPFSSMVAIEHEDATLTNAGTPERLNLLHTTAGWLPAMGVKTVEGRWFSSDEESKGDESRVAVVSLAMSLRHFGDPSNALGKAITINGRSFTIIGVMPKGFRFPYDADVWIPALASNGLDRSYCVFARLKNGASMQTVRAAMDSAADSVLKTFPDTADGFGFASITLVENLRRDEQKAAIALMGIAGFFLLLACINIANLVLARSVTRQHEEAIRAALGATRWHEFRRNLIESVLLSSVSVIGGIFLAIWLGPWLAVLVPSNYTDQLGLLPNSLNWRVLSATALLGLLAGTLCGAIPSLRRGRISDRILRQNDRTGRSRRERRIMDIFVIVQFTLALALLAGAGLMIRNLNKLIHLDLGIDPSHLLTMRISISGDRYSDAQAKRNLIRSLVQKVASTPGVRSAGVTTTNPFGAGTWVAPVVAAGRETGSNRTTFLVNHRLATPDLQRAMGIPLIRGRFFDENDNEKSTPVVLVSRLMAQKLWPNRDALYQRVRVNRPGQPWLTVVGVVGDVQDAHDPSQPKETWYLPYAQFADTPAASSIFLMVRSLKNPSGIQHAVERTIRGIDPQLAIFEISTMDRMYLQSLSQHRLSAILISILACFGLMLGALGIYGTLSLAVSERFREIGVRIAMGAQRRQVLALLFSHGIKLFLIASACGLFCAWGVGQILRNQLTQVGPLDPIALISASSLLLLIATIAIFVPAHRATGIDPIAAIRES